MKKYSLYSLLLFALFIIGCDPISDHYELSAPLTEQEIEQQITSQLEIVATQQGGNKVVLKNNSRFSGKWTLASKTTNNIIDTIVYFPGNYKVRFDATTDGGIVTVYKNLEIKSFSDPLPPPLSYLMGEFGEGVTWTYATDYPKNNWWGMVDPTNWKVFWWNPNPEGETWNNKFTFKYENGFKFIQDEQEGTFAVNDGKMQITFPDLVLHLADGWWNDIKTKTFDIKVLNENELVLLLEKGPGGGFDWMWRLKREGYNY